MSAVDRTSYRPGHYPRCQIACGYCETQPSMGCTVCGSNQTATADGINGRRCSSHPPTFSGATAVLLMRRAGVRAALVYLRTYAAMEVAA